MTSFAIPEMSCGRRSHAIESALSKLDPDATIAADVPKRLVRVETKASDALVLMVLNDLGFAANVHR
ncbi:MAG: heavy-metal-associated domain-containing protein [Dinoroseobacter sp.]|nr:heavy-metal-associated domain-containing protein [Dinoroseobacter sp.]MDJ0993297.1 heavy-metal-associated domain-containing protein [Dinoroseobacter sp.]